MTEYSPLAPIQTSRISPPAPSLGVLLPAPGCCLVPCQLLSHIVPTAISRHPLLEQSSSGLLGTRGKKNPKLAYEWITYLTILLGAVWKTPQYLYWDPIKLKHKMGAQSHR